MAGNDNDKDIRILGYSPDGTCNKLVALAAFLTLAKQNQWRAVLVDDWYQLVTQHLDVDELRRFYDFHLENKPWSYAFISWMQVLRGITVGNVVPYGRIRGCGDRKYLTAIKHMRPNGRIMEAAERVANNIRQKAKTFASVHLRSFEGRCVAKEREKYFFCHDPSYAVPPEPSTCDLTCDRAVALTGNASFSAVFLSSDRQDKNGFDGFMTRSCDGKTVYKRQGNAAQVWRGSSTASGFASDETMLMDLWITKRADYYVGNALSSCDMIAAHWRDTRTTFPARCWAGYSGPHTDEPLQCATS